MEDAPAARFFSSCFSAAVLWSGGIYAYFRYNAQRVTDAMANAKGRPDRITYGWRMPMWDPGGAKLPAWLPGVHAHLNTLEGSIFETVWMSDHLVPGATWAPPEWDTLECVTALIHFATLHPRYRYGQIVLGNSFRPPALLAKMIATLQALSGARVILGIGAGWMESEYRMYGYPYPVPKQRIEELDDALNIAKR